MAVLIPDLKIHFNNLILATRCIPNHMKIVGKCVKNKFMVKISHLFKRHVVGVHRNCLYLM